MMGCGKSTVGRRLAAALGRPFVDADHELVRRCGVPIATIFELEGEAGFRKREAALIAELALPASLVLATGGGAVIDSESRRLMREQGHVIFLEASAADLWQRLRRDQSRPLLAAPDPRGRIEALLAQREPWYREVAHQRVITGRQPVNRTVAQIIAGLPEDVRDRRPVSGPADIDPEHTEQAESN
jgi:shikimate kinase